MQIEALLFALGRPLSRSELAEMLEVDATQIEEALSAWVPGGIAIVDDGVELELRTAPVAAAVVEKVRSEEYSRDIGRAGLEALATIVYRGPLTRSEIDFIRGVNSSQTLRTLMMRGLVRKSANVSDLPDYTAVREKLTALETAYRLSALPAQAGQTGNAQSSETPPDTL